MSFKSLYRDLRYWIHVRWRNFKLRKARKMWEEYYEKYYKE